MNVRLSLFIAIENEIILVSLLIIHISMVISLFMDKIIVTAINVIISFMKIVLLNIIVF